MVWEYANIASITLVCPQEVVSIWCSPTSGTLKLNSDAAILGVGLGVVLLDHYGFVVCADVRRLPIKWGVDVVEAMEMVFGLKLALSMGVTQIIAETDSLMVVLGVNNSQTNLSYFGGLIAEIRFLLSSFTTSACVHVDRAGNSVAHYMARLAPDSDYEQEQRQLSQGTIAAKDRRGNKAPFMCFVTSQGTEVTNEIEAANGKKKSSVSIMETNQRRITRLRIEDFGWKDLAVGEDLEREAQFLILGNLSLDK